MNKLILAFLIFAALAIGCGEKKAKKDKIDSLPETENIELRKEINSIESAIIEIENVKTEINESAKKLDELLKDL